MTTEQYLQTNEIPDVIFISVKGYALDDIIPFLAKVSKENTIIIPILNIYGTGYRLAPKLPHTNVIEGCIYIVAYISAPGEISQKVIFPHRLWHTWKNSIKKSIRTNCSKP